MPATLSVLADEVREDQSCIDRAVALNAAELISVEDIELSCVMLEAVGKDLGEELSKRVQKRDGPVCLGDGVIRFVGLWNDDASLFFFFLIESAYSRLQTYKVHYETHRDAMR